MQRFRRVVEQIALQAARLLAGYDILVDGILRPARHTAVEQAQVPIRVAFSVPQVAAEEAVAPRHFVGTMRRLLHGGLDAGPQLRAHDLVRIDAEHPVVRRLLDREVLLLAIARPFMAHDPGAAGPGHFDGPVRTARVNDYDFVTPFQRVKAGTDCRFFILDDQDGGNGGALTCD